MTLPPLSSFTRGCFQLIPGLRNYGDYSSWLFPSLHLLLSNSLRSLIKHGDPEKVSKVLTRFFFFNAEESSDRIGDCYVLRHSFKSPDQEQQGALT